MWEKDAGVPFFFFFFSFFLSFGLLLFSSRKKVGWGRDEEGRGCGRIEWGRTGALGCNREGKNSSNSIAGSTESKPRPKGNTY